MSRRPDPFWPVFAVVAAAILAAMAFARLYVNFTG